MTKIHFYQGSYPPFKQGCQNQGLKGLNTTRFFDLPGREYSPVFPPALVKPSSCLMKIMASKGCFLMSLYSKWVNRALKF